MKKLQDNEKMYISNGAFYLYTLIKIYISLALKEDKEWVESQLSLMSNYQKEFNWTTIFLYKKCSMLNHFHDNQKELALSEITELISMIPNTLDSFEQTDLYFMKARIKYDLQQYIGCIEFASKAVDYYTTQLDFYCVIEALILKGASYKKLANYKRAIEVYKRALHTANLTDINYPIYMIYQNLGSVYSTLGDFTQSLSYYEKSLALRKNEAKLLPIFSIIQVYSKLKNKEMMAKYIDEGFELLNHGENKNHYYYHFIMYQQLFLEDGDINLLNEALSYFELRNDSRQVYKYGIKIADFLEKQHKYKQAASYYQRATRLHYKSISHWEDI